MRATPILRSARKALEDRHLLRALRSEIKHELSSPSSQNGQSSSLGDFVVDWDSSQSQDVVLRRKCESGEVVTVSALLSPEAFADNYTYPMEVWMKVLVKKPSMSSILQFDCGVSEKGTSGSCFRIHNVCYLQSLSCFTSKAYKGPLFSTLDPELQVSFEAYLAGKGISESLTNFLLEHLHKKEQGQYVNWLKKLESLVAEGE